MPNDHPIIDRSQTTTRAGYPSPEVNLVHQASEDSHAIPTIPPPFPIPLPVSQLHNICVTTATAALNAGANIRELVNVVSETGGASDPSLMTLAEIANDIHAEEGLILSRLSRCVDLPSPSFFSHSTTLKGGLICRHPSFLMH
jgi:hypothetical protein